MRVTFVSSVYPYPKTGVFPGIERVISEIAHALANKGYEVNVITTYRNGGAAEFDRDGKVNIYRVDDGRKCMGKLASIGALDIFIINKKLDNFYDIIYNVDIIHTFIPLIKNKNIPLICHFHHNEKVRSYKDYLFIPILNKLWKKTYIKSNAVVTVSNYSANALIRKGVLREKVYVIYNGVNLKKIECNYNYNKILKLYSNEEGAILLYVGPLIKRKGLLYLLRALAIVKKFNNNIKLIIIGKGEQEKKLKEYVSKQNIKENVDFKGFVSDEELPNYYNVCDFFVLPSLQEGFGLVMTEAMACGKPVVASNNTAIPEVVGDAGLLFENKNAEDLAQKILYLIKNGRKKNVLGLKATKRVYDFFTWDKVTDNLISVYKKCSNK